MNKEIINEIDKIVEYIEETDTYKDYKYLEEKLSKHEKAKSLIKDIKAIQKELVKLEIKKEDTKELENNINEKISQLNKIPLYREYIDKQEELNDMYQLIKNRLDDYFYNKLN